MYSQMFLVSFWIVAHTRTSQEFLTLGRITHCFFFISYSHIGIYFLLKLAYDYSWGICVDGSDLISTAELASSGGTVYGCGWPSCLTIIVSISLWDAQVIATL